MSHTPDNPSPADDLPKPELPEIPKTQADALQNDAERRLEASMTSALRGAGFIGGPDTAEPEPKTVASSAATSDRGRKVEDRTLGSVFGDAAAPVEVRDFRELLSEVRENTNLLRTLVTFFMQKDRE